MRKRRNLEKVEKYEGRYRSKRNKDLRMEVKRRKVGRKRSEIN